jgi:hypothetical protein
MVLVCNAPEQAARVIAEPRIQPSLLGSQKIAALMPTVAAPAEPVLAQARERLAGALAAAGLA